MALGFYLVNKYCYAKTYFARMSFIDRHKDADEAD
jgi:hypothetical protein